MKRTKAVASVKQLLFPARCVLCDRLLPDDSRDICPECGNAARIFHHEPWKILYVRHWFTLWQYTGTVRESLVRYKFRNRRSYSVTYGRELARKIADSGCTYDVITWVPISFLRRLRRGYDQVELLAGEVGKQLGCQPVKLLHKQRHNRKQSTLRGLEARKKNVRGVYRVTDTNEVRGKRILLLEDIITTGATVGECARTLKEAGAKEVTAACIATANHYMK